MALGAAVLVAAALLALPVPALTVRPARSGGLLWAVPARAGTRFRLTWTHTVTHRPVSEIYELGADTRLHLISMTFDEHGPNLPSAPEAGTTWTFQSDGIVVTGYAVDLDRLNLGVGPMGHRLQVGRLELDLLAALGHDRLVRLQAEREPLLLIIISEVRQWPKTRRLSSMPMNY